jgi:hypothetical protein
MTEADSTPAGTTTITGSGERNPASLCPITVARHPGSGRPGHGSGAAAEDDVLRRLALWLADVSAEAATDRPRPPEPSR